MEQVIGISLSYLDLLRAQVLRLAMSNSLVRKLFLNRALRLQTLFLAAAFFYLGLSLFFPLWVLAIGPVVWGIPHILASLRYIPHAIGSPQIKRKQITQFLVGTWVVITLLKFLWDKGYLAINSFYFPQENGVELVTGLFLIFTLSIFLKAHLRQVLVSLALFLPIAIISWLFPLETIGALILIHNWIAFIYWIRSTKTKDEQQVAFFSLAVFAFIHVLVLFGTFDFLYQFYAPQGFFSGLQLDYSDLGKTIAPWSQNSKLWFHLVVLYAFGQAVHYFIWLKAIPEQELKTEYPISFRLTWHHLLQDYGRKTLIAVCALILTSAAVWAFVQFPEARALYFIVAAVHGYLEIAGLGFIRFKILSA
jgi:hypothetical protein